MQCAAVSTHRSAMMAPPQLCPKDVCREIWNGAAPSLASSPPTILQDRSSSSSKLPYSTDAARTAPPKRTTNQKTEQTTVDHTLLFFFTMMAVVSEPVLPLSNLNCDWLPTVDARGTYNMAMKSAPAERAQHHFNQVPSQAVGNPFLAHNNGTRKLNNW